MYFVNRSDIEELLAFFDSILEEIKDRKQFQTKLQHFALERATHLLIESILDVGNRMIDGFIMRDPGSYHDIIDILIDERVLPSDEEAAYKQLVDARQMIVQQYSTVDHEQLMDVLFANRKILAQFSNRILDFLDQELGVANAFANESGGDDGAKENNQR